MLPKTFPTGGNFSWIVATAGSWSCKLSRGAAGFSFSRLADRRLWQSSSLFSKAQLRVVGPVLAESTLVHLQHLYQPMTKILTGTEIKILSERFGNSSTAKHFWFCYAGGIPQEIQHKAAPRCGYGRGMQGVEGESFTPRGEAIGAPLPLDISSRFMDIHVHSGKRIKQTKLVTFAFVPDWLGYLSNTFTATQHLSLHGIMPTADKSPGSSCRAGFGNGISKTDWVKSAHDKKELRNPATKAVIFVRYYYSFSSLKTAVNKTQQNFF